jgi:glycogen debranching enzyme
VLAVGGLPRGLLSAERARRVIDCVVAELWTPLGLRSLGRHEPGYIASYRGGPRERDASYHQGPVWLWLLGPFVEGYLRVHGDDRSARLQARERFLAPVLRELARSFGHLPELTDAEAPFALRGCPFQAWSLGEALRLHLDVLRPERPSPG